MATIPTLHICLCAARHIPGGRGHMAHPSADDLRGYSRVALTRSCDALVWITSDDPSDL